MQAPNRVNAELASGGYALTEVHSFLPNQCFLAFALAEALSEPVTRDCTATAHRALPPHRNG
ncbi:MAG: hypothetical protein AMJ67_15520 [Betaproteobacteria bacterium SG8_41]|nr:MAG: hypothetical protein AMJ67_15520 [Betaproteobacteria bacterium SG8_41]